MILIDCKPVPYPIISFSGIMSFCLGGGFFFQRTEEAGVDAEDVTALLFEIYGC